MASFRLKFESGLASRGIEVTHNPNAECDAILVIAGTKDLLPLVRARARGVRIVQRLDGINWIYRVRNTGLRHSLRAEYGNLVLSLIRSKIATHILYQSEFCHQWWENWYGVPQKLYSIVHNGVDLDHYRPLPGNDPVSAPYRLLIVEGNLGGGYDQGLENGIELAQRLNRDHRMEIELMVVGRISKEHRSSVVSRSRIPILWAGEVPREKIPDIDRSAHLLFSADLNPACPNSVIEALSCGLPVVSFDTGALNELVLSGSGRVVPYGGDPWKLEKPDIPALAEAAAEILRDQPRYRSAARAHAEKALGLDQMLDGYLKALLD